MIGYILAFIWGMALGGSTCPEHREVVARPPPRPMTRQEQIMTGIMVLTIFFGYIFIFTAMTGMIR